MVAVGLTGALLTSRSLSESLRTIDATGLTLAPGLIDAHVHVWDEAELAGYLTHGVTSIRNMSGMPWHIALSKRLKTGKILGPDFISTGPILNSSGPNQKLIHQIVETATEARAAVQAQFTKNLQVGYDSGRAHARGGAERRNT